MLDAQKWIEGAFGRWGWRQLGIAMLTLVLLALSGEALRAGLGHGARDPVALPAPGEPVVLKRWLGRDDPRGFIRLPKSGLATADKAYDVAWISGSAISVRQSPPEWRIGGSPHYEMTDVLARYVRSIGGQPIRVHEYMLQGARTADLRRAVLNAASQPEIDAYIVEFNPIWYFNDYLQFTLSRQRAEIFGEPGATSFDWSVGLRSARPSEIGLALLGAVSPIVRERGRTLGRKLFGDRTAFPYVRHSNSAARDGAMVTVWAAMLLPSPPPPPLPDPIEGLRSYTNVLMMGNLAPDTLSARILKENVRTLAATGKPVILFVPPINPRVKSDPDVVAKVDAVIAHLEAIARAVPAADILLHTRSIWDTPQPFEHRDIYHLKHGQGVVDLVVDLLGAATGKAIEKNDLKSVYGPAQKRG